MITESFDAKSKAIISPEDIISDEIKDLARKYQINSMIITFSVKLMEELIERKEVKALDERLSFGSGAGKNQVYMIEGSNVGVFLSGIGAMMSAGMIEEIYAAFACKNYIVFGSCGALVDIPSGKLIVPTDAYRDEGMSYHYAEACDYISVSNSKKLSEIFDDLKIDYVSGKTWTTDGFYRETANNKEKRVKEGCICVEMECSALQAVCDFRGLQLYQFLYAADSLNGEWSRRMLGNENMDLRLAYFYLAKKIAGYI